MPKGVWSVVPELFYEEQGPTVWINPLTASTGEAASSISAELLWTRRSVMVVFDEFGQTVLSEGLTAFERLASLATTILSRMLAQSRQVV